MLRTKIVCTIGPASREPGVLASLMLAGMNVARLNMSHGSQSYHAENIRRIRAAEAQLARAVAILVDLQGPKLRVGNLGEQGMDLQTGQRVTLTTEDEPATTKRVPVQFKRLPQAVHPGNRILLDDGLLELAVEELNQTEVICRVVTGGLLTSNKGMNLPQADLSIASISDKDVQDLRFAMEQRADWIALSFVRRAEEVLQLKEMIRELSPFGRATPVIAKIEKPEAVDNIDAIIAAVDGIMVARGDLGIETSPEAVPMMQKMIVRKCNKAGVPVITATQMLDSMIRNPRPTRAEASDVANAILDGTDAIMLSGETAVGKYPARAVSTMARIVELVEKEAKPSFAPPSSFRRGTISEAVAHAATDTVHMLDAAAILAPTVSGGTARILSRFRPPCPIIAITPSPVVQHSLALYWGVHPLLSRRAPDTDTVVQDAVHVAQEAGLIHEGDMVVITAGTGGSLPGVTDLIKVHTMARTLAHGRGIGSEKIVGRVRRLEGPLNADVSVTFDDIVVTPRTDRTFVRPLRRAAGLITTEAADDAHCVLLAMELDIPAVTGVADIDVFADGQWIVLDAEQGLVTERVGMRIPDEP